MDRTEIAAEIKAPDQRTWTDHQARVFGELVKELAALGADDDEGAKAGMDVLDDALDAMAEEQRETE